MAIRAQKNGWDASGQINEFRRLGNISANSLYADAAGLNFGVSQNVREGKPTSLIGIFSGKIDNWYSALTNGRDLQYDAIHMPIEIGRRFKQEINTWIHQFNNLPVILH